MGAYGTVLGRCRAAMAAVGAITVIGGVCAPALGERVTVYVYDFEFSINPPGGAIEDPTINVGDIIVWQCLDDHHSTVACIGQAEFWESEVMHAGDTFEYYFATPGSFNYYCGPHGVDNGDGTASGMKGTIHVVPAPGAGLALAVGGALCLGRRRR